MHKYIDVCVCTHAYSVCVCVCVCVCIQVYIHTSNETYIKNGHFGFFFVALFTWPGPNLRVVGTMSVGYDHIDLQACAARGIKVGFTPNALTNATAELTVALLLATSRRLKEGKCRDV